MELKKLLRIGIMLTIIALFGGKLAAKDTISFTWESDSFDSSLWFFIFRTANSDACMVNWGDGVIENSTDTSINHIYASPGEYTVTVSAIDSNCRFTHLDFQYSRNITYLDLADCPMLQGLKCTFNRLTELDLSGCPDLQTLSCEYNQLIDLDLTGCSKLLGLECSNNQLTGLDLTCCPELLGFDCSNNQLTDLSLTTFPNLRSLKCNGNQLQLSDLFAAHLLIDAQNNKSLGTQFLYSQTVIVGEKLFSEQSIFDGIFTNYTVTKNGNPASESDFTVIEGKLTFNTVGVYNVTMTNDAIVSQKHNPAQIIVEITAEKSTGITETFLTSNLQVYPNPATNQLRISSHGLGIKNIEIFDAMGKSVYKRFSTLDSQLSMQINISHLPAGIYLLRADKRTVKFTKK